MLSSQTLLLAGLACLLPFHCIAKLDYDFGIGYRSDLVLDQYLSIRTDDQEPGTFTAPGDFGKSI
jgi:hypothetical protein